MKTQEIVKALRCISTVHTEKTDCRSCPYVLVERLTGEDAELFGEELVSCDIDRIGLDAAQRLEELTQPRPINYSGHISVKPWKP